MNNKCPYCGKEDFIPSYVYNNIESYGNATVNFNCLICSKVINAYGFTTVSIINIKRTDNESDW